MKKVGLLLVGLLCISVSSLAGEYLMNDTGEAVTGLRVVFSEPVKLTGFGDVLNTVEPTGKATEFVFSGGELDAWAGHWLNWEPVSASLVNHKWLTDPALATSSEAVETGHPWIATPDKVWWLQQVQVPSCQVSTELADFNYVTCIAWGSSWQLESEGFVSLSEETRRVMESERPYTMGFSPITTSEIAFYSRPELADAACVNIDGERCILDWYPTGRLSPFYWGCTNNPVWQDYLVERNTAAVDLGVDAVLLDEIYGTAHSTWNAGGCFCEYCMAGFRQYLREHYTTSELKRQYGIDNLDSFDYGDFIRSEGYVSQWKSRHFWEIPLYGDYASYQNHSVVEAMRRIVGETRQYASDVYDRYIPFSANINDLNTAGLKFAELLDWFTCEAFYKDLGYPPSAKMLPLARLAAALGKKAYFITNITTNADLMGWPSTNNLLRLLITDAYAGGGAFYLPYNIHAYDEETGKSPGSFTGELDEIGYYYRFVLDNAYLFQEDASTAKVGVLFPFCSINEQLWNPSHQSFLDLCAALYDGLVPYDVVVAGDSSLIQQTPNLEDLTSYYWILVPDQSQLPSQLTQNLVRYVNGGGTVVSYSQEVATAIRQAGGVRSGIVTLTSPLSDYFRTPTASGLDRLLSKLPADLLATRVQIEDSQGARVRNVNAWPIVSDGAAVIHVINYAYDKTSDSVAPTGAVKLSIPSDLIGLDLSSVSVYLLSPDLEEPVRMEARTHDGHLEIPIDEVGIWTAVCVIAEEREAALLAETLEQLPRLAPGFVAPQTFKAPDSGHDPPLQQRQRILDAAWTAIESSKPSADNVEWGLIPFSLTFAESLRPGFHCDGDEDFSNAQFWGRQGCRVKGIGVGVSQHGLAVSVELHEGNQLGGYCYLVAFRLGTTSFYAVLTPQTNEAHLSMDSQGCWQDIGTVTGDLYQESGSLVRAWFPVELFGDVFSPEMLLASKINFHIDYREDGRRELFFFPGAGLATKMD